MTNEEEIQEGEQGVAYAEELYIGWKNDYLAMLQHGDDILLPLYRSIENLEDANDQMKLGITRISKITNLSDFLSSVRENGPAFRTIFDPHLDKNGKIKFLELIDPQVTQFSESNAH